MKILSKLILSAVLATALLSTTFAQNLNGCGPSGGAPKKCDVVQVPEPSTLWLLGLGLAGIAVACRRNQK